MSGVRCSGRVRCWVGRGVVWWVRGMMTVSLCGGWSEVRCEVLWSSELW